MKLVKTEISFITLIFFFFLVFTLSFVSADSVGTSDMTEGKIVYVPPEDPINYSLVATVNSSDWWDGFDTPDDIEYSEVGGDSFWDTNVDLGHSLTATSIFTDNWYSDDGHNMIFWDGGNNEVDLMHNLEGDEWNISAAYFFGDGRYITGINASLINLSLADHNLLNNLDWSLSGHIMDTDLDMDHNDISNIDQAYFSGTDSISSDDNNHLDIHANYIDLHGNLSTIWEVYVQGDGDGSGGDVYGELVFGSRDAMMYYNGSDFIIDPDIIGSGDVIIAGNLRVEGGFIDGLNLSNLSNVYVPYNGAVGPVNLGNNNFTVNETTLHVDSNNGRVGIGTASPTYKLDVVGDIGLDELVYHNDDTNTFIRFGEDRIRFNMGGKNMMDLFETAQDYIKLGDGTDIDINLNDFMFVEGDTGNVGIGIASPGALLHVYKSEAEATALAEVGRFTRYADADIGVNDGGYFGLRLADAGRDEEIARIVWMQDLAGGGEDDGVIGFWTANGSSNSFERMRIDSAGNVGIGTTSPQHPLHILSSTSPQLKIHNDVAAGEDAQIRFERANPGAYYWDIGMFAGNTSDFQFRSEDGGTILHMNHDGNVGIGTVSSTEKLKVSGAGVIDVRIDSSDSQATLIIDRGNSGVAGDLVLLTAAGVEGEWRVGQADAGNLGDGSEFYIGTSKNDPKLVIKTSGSVGIGTTTPIAKLHINVTNSTGGYGNPLPDAFRITNGSGDEYFFVNGTTGYVGIGTATPFVPVHIYSDVEDDKATTIGARLRIEGAKSTGGTRYVDLIVDKWGLLRFQGNVSRIHSDLDFAIGTDSEFTFGDNQENSFKYLSATNDFVLYSRDIDGIGTNGNVFEVPYGTDDVIFNGDVNITGIIINDAIYCESSELVDQDFAVAGLRYRLNISNVDEGNGITMEHGNNGTNISIDTSGVYHMVAQPQVKAGAGGAGDFHMWIEKYVSGSGWSDISDSNIELKLSSLEEDVIVLATTLKLNQGEKLRLVASVSDIKIQLHAQSPAGEPVIPSIIFTMYRIGS